MNEHAVAHILSSFRPLLQQCFATWSKIPPEVWAEEVYRLPGGARFRWSYAPYTKRIFQSYFELGTRETALQIFSRGLKSTTLLLRIGYSVDQEPRRILYLWPTNSQAEKYRKDVLNGELFDTTPPLHRYGSACKKRTGDNTLLHINLPGGLIDLFGANSPGDMRRAKGNLLLASEIDAIGQEQTDEGDQLAILNKRGDEYPDTVRIFESYPSLLGSSRINAKLLESDFNEWYVTCPVCGGEPWVMRRTEHLVFDRDKPQDARLECPRCKSHLDDKQRYAMAHLQGFDNWKPRNEFRGVRGFHANALLWPHPVAPEKYPGGFLQMLAEQVIAAEKSENPRRSLRVLVNTVDAEPFDPKEETEKAPDWLPIYRRRDQYAGVPKDAIVITGAADLQLNRIEVEWKGWGRREVSFGLEHVVIEGDIRDALTWRELKRELQRKFEWHNGASMEFSSFFIDGGKWADWVYAFLRDLSANPVEGVSGKVRAIKGFGAWPHPIVSDWRAISKNLKGYHVGTWQIKDILYARLRAQWNGEGECPDGYMRWNEAYSENYFRQLSAAELLITYEKGEEIRKYITPEGARDEALDLNVYNYAAFKRRAWDFGAIERQLGAYTPESKAEPAKRAMAPRANLVASIRGQGW